MGSGGSNLLSTAIFVGASFLLPGSAAFTTSLFVKRFVVSYGLSLVTKALAPKFKTPNELFAEQEQQGTTSTSTISSWKIPYGKTISGGQLVYSTVSKYDNNWAHLLVVFSPVAIESYEAIFLNADRVADAEFDPNKKLETNGYVQSEHWWQSSPQNLTASMAQISIPDGGACMFYGWGSQTTLSGFPTGGVPVFTATSANSTQAATFWRGDGARGIYNNSSGSAVNFNHVATRRVDAGHHAGHGWSFITLRNNFQLTSDYKDIAFFALYDGTSLNGSTAYNTQLTGISPATKNGNEENAYHYMFDDPVSCRELLGRDTAVNAYDQANWWIFNYNMRTDSSNSAAGQGVMHSEYTKGYTAVGSDQEHQRPLFKPLAMAHLTVKKDDIYQGGLPNVSAIIKGIKVYDPRESSHDRDSFLTWEWSDNPALCLLNYLTNEDYGCGISYDQIDVDSFEDLANVCDEVITYSKKSTVQHNSNTTAFSVGKIERISGGVWEWRKRDTDEVYYPFSVGDRIYFEDTSDGDINSNFVYAQPIYIAELLEDGFGFRTNETGITTSVINDDISIRYSRKKYTCNGLIDADNSMKGNIDNFLACMAAKLIYVSGKYILIGGDYSAQEGLIDIDDIIGDVSITKVTPRRDRFNTVKTTFTSPAEEYKPREAAISQDSAQIAIEQEETVVEIQLPLVTSPNQAKYLADITRKRGKASTVITMKCNMKVLQYQTGDVVRFTYDKWFIDQETFEISEMKINFGNPQSVDVTLVETSDDIYVIGSGA